MHAIVFEGSTEESGNRVWTLHIDGLSLCGDANLTTLSRGDVLWIATRMRDQRATPALCGRLIVQSVRPHTADTPGFRLAHADCAWQVIVDQALSIRCEPFAADMLISWNVWRKQFSGLTALENAHADALEALWATSPHRPPPPSA